MEPKSKDSDLCVITKDELKEIVQGAADVAVQAYRKEYDKSRKEQRGKRLRNTKLLLRIYRELKAHSESAIYEISQVNDEDVFDVLYEMTHGGDLEVSSIKKSAARTRIIIEHIDTMLSLYSDRCQRNGRAEECRRDRVIHCMYIDDRTMTAQEIADTENVDLRTVYKDIDAACEKLSAYIFGYYLD